LDNKVLDIIDAQCNHEEQQCCLCQASCRVIFRRNGELFKRDTPKSQF